MLLEIGMLQCFLVAQAELVLMHGADTCTSQDLEQLPTACREGRL
jgi:hypothetical protein